MAEMIVGVIIAAGCLSAGYCFGARGFSAMKTRMDESVKQQRIAYDDLRSTTQSAIGSANQEIGAIYKLVREMDERIESQQAGELAQVRKMLVESGASPKRDPIRHHPR